MTLTPSHVIQLQMNFLKNDLLQIILAGIVVYVQHWFTNFLCLSPVIDILSSYYDTSEGNTDTKKPP